MADEDEVKDQEEESEPKEGELSDGVLDAFEETSSEADEEDALVDIDALADQEDEDDMDYNPDEW